MDMQPVKSSNVEAIGYDSGTLRVKYHKGSAYDYAGVTPLHWAQMQTTPSIGSYIARHIKPHFQAVKVVES
jgi:hypothetical protein